MDVLPACMSVNHIYVWYPRISEETAGFPEVIDGFKPPYRYFFNNRKTIIFMYFKINTSVAPDFTLIFLSKNHTFFYSKVLLT